MTPSQQSVQQRCADFSRCMGGTQVSPVSVLLARVSKFLKWRSRLYRLLMSIHCLHLCRVRVEVFLFSALDVLLSTIRAVPGNSIFQCCPFSSMVTCTLTTSRSMSLSKQNGLVLWYEVRKYKYEKLL